MQRPEVPTLDFTNSFSFICMRLYGMRALYVAALFIPFQTSQEQQIYNWVEFKEK